MYSQYLHIMLRPHQIQSPGGLPFDHFNPTLDLPAFFLPFLSLIIECSRRKVGAVRPSELPESTVISLASSLQHPPDSRSPPFSFSSRLFSNCMFSFAASRFPPSPPLPFQMDLGTRCFLRSSLKSMQTRIPSSSIKNSANKFSWWVATIFPADSSASEKE